MLQEQALYEKEGLKVKKIHYTDNQDCIGVTFRLLLLFSFNLLFYRVILSWAWCARKEPLKYLKLVFCTPNAFPVTQPNQ